MGSVRFRQFDHILLVVFRAEGLLDRFAQLFIRVDCDINRLDEGLSILNLASILIKASSLPNDGLARSGAELDMDF